MAEFSFPKDKIKVLLLEGVSSSAVEYLREAGYSVTENPKSLKPEELLEVIKDVHVLGIRSKTKITAEHLQAARRLLTIGCFGVGTNQVPLDLACQHGVPVFNAPISSTRSVAELSVGCLMMLARRACDLSARMHQGRWVKSASGSIEIKEKILGLIGYGHIGQQVGLLAESVGMQVIFTDPIKKQPLGRARQVASIKEVLAGAGFVSLHLPATKDDRPIVTANELALMKKGSYLLNLSRGSLVDLKALRESLLQEHLAGAALDVYPAEPKSNDEPFECELAGVPNVILTPHIGGSTEQAQYNIGLEVAQAFTGFIDNGTTSGAVNFPQINLPSFPDARRILYIHRNVPGVISEVARIVADLGVNIETQYLGTFKDTGYLIMDLNKELSDAIKAQIAALPYTIKTRILF